MIKVFLTSEYKPTPDSQAFAEEIAKIENEIQAWRKLIRKTLNKYRNF